MLVRIVPDIHKVLVSRLSVTSPRCGPFYNPEWNKLVAALYQLSGVSRFAHLAAGDLELSHALLGQLTVESPKQMMSFTLLYLPGRPAEIGMLATFVRSAVHLEKLTVDVSSHAVNVRAMLEEALRENGSLIHACKGLTDNVYHRRNANLRLLLAQRPMPLADVSLLPSRLQAAKAAKKMAANFIFAGLLGCDHLDNVHDRGQLRMRPVSD
jgi:hypothetical protein